MQVPKTYRMSTLIENNNSGFWEVFSKKMKPKNAPKQVNVYVESEEDIAFWRHIFKTIENSNLQFHIHLPSNSSLSKGKQKALERTNDIFTLIPSTCIGEFLIVCIDSDYDYLLDNYSKYSALINSSKYIFQTYSYSTENLKCHASNLRNLCVSATLNDKNLIDFEELLKNYSSICYNLFVWNLYFYNKKDFTTFTLTSFCDIIKIPEVPKIDEFGKTSFENLNKRILLKLNELEANYPSQIREVEEFSKQLKNKGLEIDNCYLFMHGHTIFDNVVLMFLKSVCKALREEHEQNIKTLAKHNLEKKTNIEQYHHHLKKNDITFLLSNNNDFTNCFLYKKIIRDISDYSTEILIA